MGKKNPISQVASFVVDPLDISGTRKNWASGEALAQQERGAAEANATRKQIYDQNRQDNEPYRQAGVQALGQMQSTDFQKDFSMSDFQADPGYQFRMAEGTKALERSAAARGGLLSGGTGKALQNYGQRAASEEYGAAYNRFNNDRTNRFNRLASLSGSGQTANAQVGDAGKVYGDAVSANQLGISGERAASRIGRYETQQQGINQGIQVAGLLACDENLKTNIEPVSPEDLAELRSAIKPYKFNYANDIYGRGDWVGPMAQDLEKTKLGKSMVVTDTDGFKKIDINKFAALLLSTMGEV